MKEDKETLEEKKSLKTIRVAKARYSRAKRRALARWRGPRYEIIGGTGRESRETTVFHAFERRAAERTSGQRRLGGGKRELVVAFVAVSIDSSVKAVRERE